MLAAVGASFSPDKTLSFISSNPLYTHALSPALTHLLTHSLISLILSLSLCAVRWLRLVVIHLSPPVSSNTSSMHRSNRYQHPWARWIDPTHQPTPTHRSSLSCQYRNSLLYQSSSSTLFSPSPSPCTISRPQAFPFCTLSTLCWEPITPATPLHDHHRQQQ